MKGRWLAALPRSILLCALLSATSLPARAASLASDGSIIIHHGDPEYSEGGHWENGADSWDQRGSSYSLARQTQDPGAWAQWTPILPAGEYDVDLWNIPHNSQDSHARIEVVHAAGTSVFQRDMHDAYYGWVPLGKFRFDADHAGSVKIIRGDRTLLVDAVRFRPARLVKPPQPLKPYPRPDGKVPYLDHPGPGGHLILGGQPYLMLGGELENGSALYAPHIPFMDGLFDILLAQHINTVEAPIAWRQLEPKEGEWDYRVIDALIDRARARNMTLSILWFGAYKNLQSYYSPPWVHTNKARFPFLQQKDGKPSGAISPFCEELLRLDIRAFSNLLARIKERDPDHQVVLMMQVENELPSWRDYSEPGQRAWAGPVPPELIQYLTAHPQDVSPWLRDVWQHGGRKTTGTWSEVFGDNDDADRVFGSWSFGRYTDGVAAAGKQVLNLPMYCNSWRGESPAWHKYMDVFHAAAPHIDFLGPDLYLRTGFRDELDQTLRPWNTLILPENDSTTAAAARAWTAYGKYGALFFGSYLGPETEWTHCKETYELLDSLSPLLLPRMGTSQMLGFNQEVEIAGDAWEEPFQGSRLRLIATNTLDPGGERNNLTGGEIPGCGLITTISPGEYLLVGSRIDLEWYGPAGKKIKFRSAEEGHYLNGHWQGSRPAPVEVKPDHLTFHFPHENDTFRQIRCRVEME